MIQNIKEKIHQIIEPDGILKEARVKRITTRLKDLSRKQKTLYQDVANQIGIAVEGYTLPEEAGKPYMGENSILRLQQMLTDIFRVDPAGQIPTYESMTAIDTALSRWYGQVHLVSHLVAKNGITHPFFELDLALIESLVKIGSSQGAQDYSIGFTPDVPAKFRRDIKKVILQEGKFDHGGNPFARYSWTSSELPGIALTLTGSDRNSNIDKMNFHFSENQITQCMLERMPDITAREEHLSPHIKLFLSRRPVKDRPLH